MPERGETPYGRRARSEPPPSRRGERPRRESTHAAAGTRYGATGLAIRSREEEPEGPSYRLTQACWPVFEFVIHFKKQVKFGDSVAFDQVRFSALQAFRNAEELARDDPATERVWQEKGRAMLTYFIDYMMINTPWEGREAWLNNPFELDREILNHTETLGGEKFYDDCDEIQREYEQAERRDRRDRHELGELLTLYFTCLRLGFKGKFDGFPNELAAYTRHLYSKLPAYAATKGKELFPEAYENVEAIKVDYKLGVSLITVLITFAVVFGAWMGLSTYLWQMYTYEIRTAAESFMNPVSNNQPPASQP